MSRTPRTGHQRTRGPDGLSTSLRLLLASGGTFVELLEVCVGEPIGVRKIAVTRTRVPEALPVLSAAPGTLVIDRLVLLCRVSHPKALGDAQARIIPGRLPAAVVNDLDNTSMPLGQLLVDHGVLTMRRPIETWTETAGASSGHGEFSPGEPLVCRAYTISAEAGPAVLITERLRQFGPWE